MIQIVVKRDGRVVGFNEEKIKEIQIINQNQNDKLSKCIKSEILTQHTILRQFILNKTNKEINKICEFLLYLLNKNHQSKQPMNIFYSIFIPGEADDFNDIIKLYNQNKKEIKEIGIKSKTFEMLYAINSFNLSDLFNQLNSFSKIYIKLRNTISKFDIIIQDIYNIKQIKSEQISIEIIYESPVNHLLTKHNEIINNITIEPSITTIEKETFYDCSFLTNF